MENNGRIEAETRKGRTWKTRTDRITGSDAGTRAADVRGQLRHGEVQRDGAARLHADERMSVGTIDIISLIPVTASA